MDAARPEKWLLLKNAARHQDNDPHHDHHHTKVNRTQPVKRTQAKSRQDPGENTRRHFGDFFFESGLVGRLETGGPPPVIADTAEIPSGVESSSQHPA